MSRAWDRYWYGDVSAARPWLLMRGVLLMLAFDLWLVMVEHGGRYGAGGFNVAHFRWLGALQPMPSPELYVGVLLVCGLIAFALALGRPSRLLLGVLTALYTWAWAMSMLDSYQHHYLLSLLLLSMVFFPRLGSDDVFASDGAAEEAEPRRARSISAWAWGTFATTCAIVYFYTAVTKAEPDWRQGHALRRLTAGGEPFAPLKSLFVGSFGMTEAGFWELLGTSVILVQLVICAGYLLSVRRDTLRHPAARTFCWIALLAALSFHAGAEHLGLRIGWFSYYVILTALAFMLPRAAVDRAAWALGWPGRRIAALWERWTASEAEQPAERATVAAMGLAAAGLEVLFGHLVDLPGSLAGSILAAVALACAVVLLARRGRLREAQRWLVTTTVGAAVMWIAIAGSTVRFDYYRLVGGDMRRRGAPEAALAAYVKANRYAPRDPAQQAEPRGDCGESLGWAWTGEDCVELRGCACEGADCTRLAEDRETCEDSFDGDRDEAESELRSRLGMTQ